MAIVAQNMQSTARIIHFVEAYIVAPVTGFLNSLYSASTTDFDVHSFATKSDMELADIGFRRDDLALVVRPSHLDR